jgi:hypothetical protein
MNRRRTKAARVVIASGLILVMILAVVLVWNGARRSEPVYEGKPLSRWLEGHLPNSSANPPLNSPGWKKADEALRRIGTNAIPTLLQMIRAKDPPKPVLKLLDLLSKKRLVVIRYRSAFHRNDEAEYAFQMLGTNAACAVPALTKIYQDNVSPNSQRCAALALAHMGPAAIAAVPVLMADFVHTNADVRFYAVSAIIHIGGDPDIVVPALKSLLKDPKTEVRFNAVAALRRFGTRARPAIPELMEARSDQDQGVRDEVDDLLWGLVPEKVAKPLVVEESTPMVAGGITTEALSQRGWGYGPDEKLFTLIPQGKAVRCAMYQGVGDQPLYLYRGRTQTPAKDHFLGHFEAVPSPAPATNINIEVAYIVDNERIVLCARDHERKQFVELRRVETEAAK